MLQANPLALVVDLLFFLTLFSKLVGRIGLGSPKAVRALAVGLVLWTGFLYESLLVDVQMGSLRFDLGRW